MGKLSYGNDGYAVEVEDRMLAHVKIVILTKLRRGESFSVSWTTTPADGSGRHTLWIHPAIPLRFDFFGSRSPALNRTWIALMLATIAQTGDLTLTDEPDHTPIPPNHERNLAPVAPASVRISASKVTPRTSRRGQVQ